jgi:hypothetical protein
MPGLLYRLKDDARNIARAAAFSFAGLFLMVAGLFCLTAALWIVIANHYGAIHAFTLLGIIYLVLGAVFLLLAMRRPRYRWTRHPLMGAAPPPREPLVQIAEGFAIGMQAGRAARRRPRRGYDD